MATKLSATIAKKVKALGIKANNEEEARVKLLKILGDNGIDGMEEEDTETLIDIAESFVDEEESSDEKESDELAEEVSEEEDSDEDTGDEDESSDEEEEEESADEEEEEEEEEEDSSDEFENMDRAELKKYIKENGLKITVKKSMSDDDIRSLIREAVNNDEEEEEKPKKSVKKENKKENKKETKAKSKTENKEAEKKKTEKKIGKRGLKLYPKTVEKDREFFEPLKDLFPEDEFNYAWVASSGVTIKYNGNNSNRSMVLIENCSKQEDGSVKCNLYLLTFNKQTEVLDEAGIDYELCWSGAPLVKGITLDEAIEIIKGLLDNILSFVKKIDKKLGENRKKMEDNLNKKAAKTSKKSVKEEEDDEEEEEEEEKPKKSVKKTTAKNTKKTTKK